MTPKKPATAAGREAWEIAQAEVDDSRIYDKPNAKRVRLSRILAIEAEAAASTPAEPLDEYERSTVYVALTNLNHEGRRWSWWNGTDWQQGDSGDFADAFIAEYNRHRADR